MIHALNLKMIAEQVAPGSKAFYARLTKAFNGDFTQLNENQIADIKKVIEDSRTAAFRHLDELLAKSETLVNN